MNNRGKKADGINADHFTSLSNHPEQDSTINSTANSDLTSISQDSLASTLIDGHLQHCIFKHSGQCICSNLIKHAKAREKRKRRELERTIRKKLDSSSSEEEESDYSKNRGSKTPSVFSFKSLESFDYSYYTAETGPSKPPSTVSSDTYETSRPFFELSASSSERISDVCHEMSNNQSMISCIEEGLYSHLKNETNPSATEKIEPFFKRLSIVAQKASNDNSFKECLTDIYQVCQQAPEEFASKLATILEESTLPPDDYSSVTYFQEIFTKFKHLEIQDESLPKSFINKTMSPAQMSEEVLCQQFKNFENSTISKKLSFSTPATPQGSPEKKIYKSTPKVIKNFQASPLFISTMNRFIEANNLTPKSKHTSPVHPESASTPLSDSTETSKHNESSFTYLEKKYVGRGASAEHLNMPELTNEEKRSILLCEKQLKALQYSPCRAVTKKDEDSMLDSPCSAILKKKEVYSSPDSSCLTSTMKEHTRLCSSPCSPRFTSTKVYEKISNVDVDNKPSSILVENHQDDFVNESIFHEYVTQRRRCLETEKTIREIQAASQNGGINRNLLNVLTECSDYQKAAKTSNKLNSEAEDESPAPSSKSRGEKRGLNSNSKPSTPKNTNITLRKGIGVTQSDKKMPVVRTSLSRTKVKSSGCSVSTRSPIIHARGLNIESPRLKVQNKSRSPSPCLTTRDRSKSRSPMPPHKTPAKFKTPTNTLNIKKSVPIPEIFLIPSSPSCWRSSPFIKTSSKSNSDLAIKKEQSPISSAISLTTPLKPRSRGKYFRSPDRTPVPKQKPKKYFHTPEALRENVLNLKNVRSPIKDYIHGSDMCLVQTVRSQTNENLLLENAEKLKSGCIKKKKENDENRPGIEATHPKVHYTKPSAVYELAPSPKKNLGARRKQLEQKPRPILIRHEGRTSPAVIEDVNADYSIHVTKVAEKTTFHIKSKNNTRK